MCVCVCETLPHMLVAPPVCVYMHQMCVWCMCVHYGLPPVCVSVVSRTHTHTYTPPTSVTSSLTLVVWHTSVHMYTNCVFGVCVPCGVHTASGVGLLHHNPHKCVAYV